MNPNLECLIVNICELEIDFYRDDILATVMVESMQVI